MAVEPDQRGLELRGPELPHMPARIDAKRHLDAGFGERTLEQHVAALEAWEVTLADREIESGAVGICAIGRNAREQVPAVDPPPVERRAEGAAEHGRAP